MQPPNELKIAILSRNRHQELSKTINYYHGIGIPTVVLHKTEVAIESWEIPETCDYSLIDQTYAVRCGILADKINSKYAILSSDDERYLPGALSQMISQLNAQNGQGSVGGRNLAVGRYGKRITATETFSNLNGYRNFEAGFDSAISQHFNSSVKGVRVGSLYRMYSRNQFKSLFRSLSYGKLSNSPYIFECIAEVASLSLGPVTYLDNLYWLRNWSNEMVQSSDWNRKITFSSWWNSEQNFHSKKSLLVGLEAELGVSLVSLERAFTELNNNRIAADSRVPKTNSNWRVNENFKYAIKKLARSKHLPLTLLEAQDSFMKEGVAFSEGEVNCAIESLFSKTVTPK